MLQFKTIEPSTLELLKGLQGIAGLKTTRLVGGTGLALQIGHRISVDLDLFAYNLQEDFIDLYYLLKLFSLNEMLSFYEKKYNDSSTFLVLKSLTYFEDADLEISPNLFDNQVHWQEMKGLIRSEVQKLI